MSDVPGHYSRGVLRARLRAALIDDGADPDHPSLDALAPYDQFHGRGLEATIEIADALAIGAADHLLDVGSGIGGPARYFANRFGCHVTGIDRIGEIDPPAVSIADQLCSHARLAGAAQSHHGHQSTRPQQAAQCGYFGTPTDKPGWIAWRPDMSRTSPAGVGGHLR